MRLLDAIEFAIRRNNGPMDVKDIFPAVKDLVLEDDLTEQRVLVRARTEPEIFEILGKDTIGLTATRLSDNAKVFEKRIWQMRDALRLLPNAEPSLLSSALICALVTREPDTLPTFGSAPETQAKNLEHLIQRFSSRHPAAFEGLNSFVQNLSFIQRAPLNDALILASQVIPEAEKVVEIMRSEPRRYKYRTPWPIANFMATALGPPGPNIYDPNASSGLLSAFVAAHQGLDVYLAGYVEDDWDAALLDLELTVLGTSADLTIGPPPLAGDNDDVSGFSLGLADPPSTRTVDERTGWIRRSDWDYATHTASACEKAAILLPVRALSALDKGSRGDKALMFGMWKKMAVVELPAGVLWPDSSMRAAILFVLGWQEPPDAPNPVLFINIADQVKDPRDPEALQAALDVARTLLATWEEKESISIVVSEEEIAKNGYNFTPSRYLNRSDKKLKEALREGRNLVPLKELVLPDNFKRIGASQSEKLNDAPQAPALLRVKDLAHEPAHPYLKLPTASEIKGPVTLVDEDSFLISKQFLRPYPTVFQFKGRPIALPQSIIALKLDQDKVVPEYLAAEMGKPYFAQQIVTISRGNAIQQFTKADLLDTLVELPPLEEQRASVADKRDVFKMLAPLNAGTAVTHADLSRAVLEAIKANGYVGSEPAFTEAMQSLLDAVRDRSQHEELERVRENLYMLRHQFNNRLGWVTSGLNSLDAVINRLIDEGIIPKDTRTAPSLEGEETQSPTLTDAMAQLLHNADALPELLEKVIASLVRTETEMEVIDFEELIRNEIIPLYANSPLFQIAIDAGSKGPYLVRTDKFKLKQAIVNICDNAIRHGFLDPTKRYSLGLTYGVAGGGGGSSVTLLIANDGEPPSIPYNEMVLRGRIAGSKGGTGEGLYWADLIIRQLGGTLVPFGNPEFVFDRPMSFGLFISLPISSR